MLNREEIEKLIQASRLIEGAIDLNTQLTPNGIDLTAGDIFEFEAAGALDFSNKERLIPQGKEIQPKKKFAEDKFGWWDLKKGAYKVKTNETLNIPKGLVAMAFTRTSLLRAGAFTGHGVWDAGFSGKSEFLLAVDNPFGLKLKQNARVAQVVFFTIDETQHSYNGIYQNLK